VVQKKSTPVTFTGYQKFLIAILTILQFTVILDFMVLAPLGAILMPTLHITPQQFGWVVSAYALSAGASGLLAAGFADRFDRKNMLMLFYVGFLVGTLFCGLAPNYHALLAARIFTGIFGGVIGAISFAIVTDLFPMEVRGRVMGYLQMAFASSQVFGLPLGLYAANHWGWHSPFIMIVALGIPVGFIIFLRMQGVNAHLALKIDRHPFHHIWKTVSTPRYLQGFAATTLLATGGFMLMPFSSAFATGNLGLSLDDLPLLYMVTGVCAMIAGPVAGRLSDTIGKYPVFVGASLAGIAIALYFTQLSITPLWFVMVLNGVLFIMITGRIVSSSALISGVPAPQDRGAYMGISSAFQQISGGISSAIAGLIVTENAHHILEHYDVLGYVVAGTMLITIIMMYFIHRLVNDKPARA